jgi:hypothetical protein
MSAQSDAAGVARAEAAYQAQQAGPNAVTNAAGTGNNQGSGGGGSSSSGSPSQSELDAANGIRQSQENVAAGNQLLTQINLKLAGQLPLTGGETAASLLNARQVLERAQQAENQSTGVSASFGSNPAQGASLTAFGRYQQELLAQPTSEVYAATHPSASSSVTIPQLQAQARTADIAFLSESLGLSAAIVESNYESGLNLKASLGAQSYSNLLETGLKTARETGKPTYVGGLGVTLSITETPASDSAAPLSYMSYPTVEQTIETQAAFGNRLVSAQSLVKGGVLLQFESKTPTYKTPLSSTGSFDFGNLSYNETSTGNQSYSKSPLDNLAVYTPEGFPWGIVYSPSGDSASQTLNLAGSQSLQSMRTIAFENVDKRYLETKTTIESQLNLTNSELAKGNLTIFNLNRAMSLYSLLEANERVYGIEKARVGAQTITGTILLAFANSAVELPQAGLAISLGIRNAIRYPQESENIITKIEQKVGLGNLVEVQNKIFNATGFKPAQGFEDFRTPKQKAIEERIVSTEAPNYLIGTMEFPVMYEVFPKVFVGSVGLLGKTAGQVVGAANPYVYARGFQLAATGSIGLLGLPTSGVYQTSTGEYKFSPEAAAGGFITLAAGALFASEVLPKVGAVVFENAPFTSNIAHDKLAPFNPFIKTETVTPKVFDQYEQADMLAGKGTAAEQKAAGSDVIKARVGALKNELAALTYEKGQIESSMASTREPMLINLPDVGSFPITKGTSVQVGGGTVDINPYSQPAFPSYDFVLQSTSGINRVNARIAAVNSQINQLSEPVIDKNAVEAARSAAIQALSTPKVASEPIAVSTFEVGGKLVYVEGKIVNVLGRDVFVPTSLPFVGKLAPAQVSSVGALAIGEGVPNMPEVPSFTSGGVSTSSGGSSSGPKLLLDTKLVQASVSRLSFIPAPLPLQGFKPKQETATTSSIVTSETTTIAPTIRERAASQERVATTETILATSKFGLNSLQNSIQDAELREAQANVQNSLQSQEKTATKNALDLSVGTASVQGTVQSQSQSQASVQSQAQVSLQAQVQVQSQAQVQVQTRTLTRILTKIRTNESFLPPIPQFKFGKEEKEPAARKKYSLNVKTGGKPFAFASLLNVNRSQILYGKGTSPSAARPETQKAIKSYAYNLQTVEEIKHEKKGNRGNAFKLGIGKFGIRGLKL